MYSISLDTVLQSLVVLGRNDSLYSFVREYNSRLESLLLVLSVTFIGVSVCGRLDIQEFCPNIFQTIEQVDGLASAFIPE